MEERVLRCALYILILSLLAGAPGLRAELSSSEDGQADLSSQSGEEPWDKESFTAEPLHVQQLIDELLNSMVGPSTSSSGQGSEGTQESLPQ